MEACNRSSVLEKTTMRRDRRRTAQSTASVLCGTTTWIFYCCTALIISSIPTSFATDEAISANNKALAESTTVDDFLTFKLHPRESFLKGQVSKEVSNEQQPEPELLSRVLKGDEKSPAAATAAEQQPQQQSQLVLKRQRGNRRGRNNQRGNRNKPRGRRGNPPGINKRNNNRKNGGKPSGQNNNNNWSSGKLCPCPTWQGTTKWWGGRQLFHNGRSPPTNSWSRSSSWNNAWRSGGKNGWGTSNNSWNTRSSWGMKWCACPTDPPTKKPTKPPTSEYEMILESMKYAFSSFKLVPVCSITYFVILSL